MTQQFASHNTRDPLHKAAIREGDDRYDVLSCITHIALRSLPQIHLGLHHRLPLFKIRCTRPRSVTVIQYGRSTSAYITDFICSRSAAQGRDPSPLSSMEGDDRYDVLSCITHIALRSLPQIHLGLHHRLRLYKIRCTRPRSVTVILYGR
ncbi:hypothetical protein J6590_070803 [Homalodisca vitripennis]|nr:hypothetical protein J6590_070803 [Homalodisca vitripennis]